MLQCLLPKNCRPTLLPRLELYRSSTTALTMEAVFDTCYHGIKILKVSVMCRFVFAALRVPINFIVSVSMFLRNLLSRDLSELLLSPARPV